jgi:hypothetical protein
VNLGKRTRDRAYRYDEYLALLDEPLSLAETDETAA